MNAAEWLLTIGNLYVWSVYYRKNGPVWFMVFMFLGWTVWIPLEIYLQYEQKAIRDACLAALWGWLWWKRKPPRKRRKRRSSMRVVVSGHRLRLVPASQ